MSLRPSSATLALTAAFGCAPGPEPATTDTAASTADATDATTDATTTPTSSGGPTATDATTGEAPVWCRGLDPDAAAKLTATNEQGVDIIDGAPLQVVCGGQGSMMIPIYPHFGGFVPDGDNLGFDVVLDVEGFNLGPDGHFFAAVGHQHDVNCAYTEPYYEGYSYSFIPMFPPDAIPDILAVDGKPGVLRVTLHSPIGDMQLDAAVVLAVPPDFSCGYDGGYDTDTDTGGGSSGGTSG